MGFWVVRRTKRLWTDEEKRSICLPTMASEVSVAQVAWRYALNANMIVDFHAEVRRVFHRESYARFWVTRPDQAALVLAGSQSATPFVNLTPPMTRGT